MSLHKMLNIRRLLGAARALPLLLAAWAAGAAAQDTNTVGPPQLRDFTLPGRRTTPPAQVQPQPAPPPAATTPAPAPPPRATAPTPAPERARASRVQRRVPPKPAPAPAGPARAPAPAPTGAAPAPAPVVPVATPAPPPVAAPPAAPAPEAPAPAPVPSGLPGWLWPIAALLLLAAAAAAALVLLRRRRREPPQSLTHSFATWREEPEPAAPPPAPPPPPPAPTKRPRLEVDIRPDRAQSTDEGAFVHYGLTLTNTGDAPAGNIRIDGRMFNASADGVVDSFFDAPIHEVSGSPHVFIAPGESIALDGQIGMPRDELQPIEVQGRVIFVPLVAINVAYDWEGGSGRTSTSWVVGRQPSTPAAKMGAFRLDLGPRIYRQLDRREAKKRLA